MIGSASGARAARHGAGSAATALVLVPTPGAGSCLADPAWSPVDGDARFTFDDANAGVAARATCAGVSGAAGLSGGTAALALEHRCTGEAVGAGSGRWGQRWATALAFRSARSARA